MQWGDDSIDCSVDSSVDHSVDGLGDASVDSSIGNTVDILATDGSVLCPWGWVKVDPPFFVGSTY